VNRFIEIIKYTWKAKGRHGIHSPFVYDLVDICFKIPVSKNNTTKCSKLTAVHSSALSCLIQLSKHLKYSSIITEPKIQMDIESLMKDLHGQAKVQGLSHFDNLEKEIQSSIVLLKTESENVSLLDQANKFLPLIDEHSILLIDGIRTNDSVFSEWQQLLSNTEFHFSADLYQFGLLAKRSFQEKEHFVLRY
jgi:hypothetical protein